MKNILRLLSYAKKYRPYYAWGMTGLVIMTLSQLCSPKIISYLIELIGGDLQTLKDSSVRLALMLLGLYIIAAVGQFLRSYCMHYGAWHFLSDLRIMIFEKYESLSIRYYHDKQTGQLMSRITNDTSALESLIAHSIPDLIVNSLKFAGVAIILFTINWKMALISMILMPAIGYAAWYYAKNVRPMFKTAHQKMAELSAVLQDDFSGMKEIQIFNQQEREKEKMAKFSLDHCIANMKAHFRGAIYHPAIEFFNNLGLVLVIGFGGYFAYRGYMDAADIVAFVLYLNMFYQPVSTLGRLNEDLQNALAASERIFEVLDTSSEITDSPDAADIGRADGRIEFENVDFNYNENADVFEDISVTVEPGETLALVGPTGVGKTTFISLIARFYDPCSGRITVDGHDLRDITQYSLRENISMVLQDVFLFNDTVAANIAYGVKNATREQIIEAAKIANADEFISQMENGYDTMIGERGVRLSGGQKQRISIARAVLRNAPILILDEATASVDTVTERLIQQAIDKVVENKTTIIIAHRLSTVKNADKIAVLDEGRIAELGSHDELIKKDGLYTKLCKLQFAE